MSIPTLIIFKDGQPVEQMVWVQQADALKEALEKHM
jgi:thioredoxin 1